MKYLGYLTGKVYEEDEIQNVKECIWEIPDAVAVDEKLKRIYYVPLHVNCYTCSRCFYGLTE